MDALSDDDLRLVEALLLASPEPVTSAQVQHALGDEHGLLVDVPAVIAAVAERYRGRGIAVAAAGGGWRGCWGGSGRCRGRRSRCWRSLPCTSR